MTRNGMTPDPWQTQLLRSSSKRQLVMCSRQAGKSTTAAAMAMLEAVLRPPALILVLSPTQRQSGELFRAKVLPLLRGMTDLAEVGRETALTLELTNGSRIISLPENEEGIRGYSSVSLLIVDEASRVDDSLYRAVRPMLAVSKGRLIALSTPFGKRGWFFDEWEKKTSFERIKITADQIPRITPEFLAEELEALGDRWYRQEYFCEFTETIGSVFGSREINAAVDQNIQPLFGV